MKKQKKLLLISHLALYPMHWQAFEHICRHYQVIPSVIGQSAADIPNVHRQLGWADAEQVQRSGMDLRLLPQGNRLKQVVWLIRQLREINPDYIWVQEEPTSSLLYAVLFWYRLNPRPQIATAVCENIFKKAPFWKRWMQKILWSRLNSLLGTAACSIEGIQLAGMPAEIPSMTLVAGALTPPENISPLKLPFAREENDFIAAFAGRICEEKGWKVLLAALEMLPPNYKCIIAGDGPQREQLLEWLQKPSLKERVDYRGLLCHEELMRFFETADCLILPSLTLPQWKEQFGGVLADAMALGLPLIGSDSGSIPEVIGPAGIITHEGDEKELADALKKLGTNRDLCARLGQVGKQRFENEFSIEAYAKKIASGLNLPMLME